MINISIFYNLDLLLVGLAIASTGILGFTVFLSNTKSTTNRLFLAFCVVTVVWGLLNYLSYKIPDNLTVLWLIRFVMFFAVLQSYLFFLLMYVFPEKKIKYPSFFKYFIGIIILACFITLTKFVFSGIIRDSTLSVAQPIVEPGIIIFALVTLTTVISGIYLIGSKIKKSISHVYVFLGTVIMFFLIIAFNFISPAFFNNSSFIPLGALFILPFVAFTAYAILRHKLFNIKVAGVAVLVFALSVVTFFEVILADNLSLIIYRSGILLFILAFGILLIRSVVKEVEQREEIARMAEDVRRAYVIEKKAKEELEKLDKVKDQFVMTTQHNLRTPLTSMMGYTDLLLQGTFGKQSRKTTEVIKRLQGSTQSLIKMVNNFLDIAQFQLGRSVITLKSGVEAVLILDEIVNDLKFKAEQKNVALNFDRPDTVFKVNADAEKLKAALFNIVDNAVKYTEKGQVDITMGHKSPDQKNIVLIKVKDTGIGIEKDKAPKIFEQMFERSEEAKRIASVGTGVGLYLSGQIIRAHNGKVWVESEGVGKGSTFFVELPVDQGQEEKVVAPVPEKK